VNVLHFAARLFVDWCVISCIVGLAYAVAMSRFKSRRAASGTRRAVYPPPVPAPVTPPFSQALPSAEWFDGMPVEILSDEAVHSLFDRLVDLDDNLRDLA